jgi:seryl-tRNA synthetase
MTTVESRASAAADPMEEQRAFRDALFSAGLLLPTGVEGLYLRSDTFESIVQAIDAVVSRAAADEGAAAYHFPLVVPAVLLEKTDYIRSFPELIASLNSYGGGESGYGDLLAAADRGQWQEALAPTGLGLCSAACHPLYPVLAGQTVPAEGRKFEIVGQCFRHEPSPDPARMQTFRQHEVVYVGDAAGARAHRDRWVERGLALHRRLGLEVEAVVANDPFFGRAGDLLAANQRADALKIELVAPVSAEESLTAITSANCHLEHFGEAFGIRGAGGGPAHSACVGFGVERVALALLAAHGLVPARWPAGVRRELGW